RAGGRPDEPLEAVDELVPRGFIAAGGGWDELVEGLGVQGQSWSRTQPTSSRWTPPLALRTNSHAARASPPAAPSWFAIAAATFGVEKDVPFQIAQSLVAKSYGFLRGGGGGHPGWSSAS